jgi:hypothetical protein
VDGAATLYASPLRLIDAEPAIEHPELRRPSSGKLNWSPEREKGRLGETFTRVEV